MPLDQETITQQQKLLADHRQRLALLFEQQAKLGAYTPPYVIIDIREAQDAIRPIKATLRENGIRVDDEPNDEAPPQPDVNQTVATGPRVQSSVTVQDNKGTAIGAQFNQPNWAVTGNVTNVAGDQRTIDTRGGDYVEGNIDKRQGTFIDQQIVQIGLAPALHQIHAPVPDFVGRTSEIDQLVLALSATNNGAAATIAVIRGMGGTGKSALAYAVANQLKDAFPDAQLLVELRGASSNPLTPEQALQTVIRAFERETKLPDDLGQLQSIYDDKLSGKRVLILADDARDAAQMRSFLPPSGCALLVTSRNRFSLPGMAALDLGMLPPEDAEKLVLKICPRIGEHAAKLAKLCGYLPLALRVSASLLKTNDTRDVAHYLERLETERLKQLTDPDDPVASVEASLQLSYNALEPAAQAALCQLSVFPTSFDLAAAQAIVVVAGGVDEVLELLRRRSLLEWVAALERYSLHDLVRAFGAARLEDADTGRLRHARYYAGLADSAQTLYQQGGAATLTGLALFDRERVHIDAGWGWAREQSDNADADALLLDYPNALYAMADLRYDQQRERIPQLEAQLAAAQRMGRRNDEEYALGSLGLAYAALGDARQAIAFYEQQLAIAREIGDRHGEADALGSLGVAYADLGEARQAIAFHEQALGIYREIGSRSGEGASLGSLGNAYNALGDARQAIDFFEQQLVIVREIGDRQREGYALDNLGSAYAALGDARQAIAFHEQALGIYREIGDRRGEASASWNLGLALEQQGDLARAAELMQVYVDFLRELGHPDAETRAAELEQLRQRIAGGSGGPAAGDGRWTADDVVRTHRWQ